MATTNPVKRFDEAWRSNGNEPPPSGHNNEQAIEIVDAEAASYKKAALPDPDRLARIKEVIVSRAEGQDALAEQDAADFGRAGQQHPLDRLRGINAALTATLAIYCHRGGDVSTDLLLAYFIAVHSDNRYGRCTETLERMAQFVGRNTSTVSRRLKKLRDDGLIRISEVTGKPTARWLVYDDEIIKHRPFDILEAIVPRVDARRGRPPKSIKSTAPHADPLLEKPPAPDADPFLKNPLHPMQGVNGKPTAPHAKTHCTPCSTSEATYKNSTEEQKLYSREVGETIPHACARDAHLSASDTLDDTTKTLKGEVSHHGKSSTVTDLFPLAGDGKQIPTPQPPAPLLDVDGAGQIIVCEADVDRVLVKLGVNNLDPAFAPKRVKVVDTLMKAIAQWDGKEPDPKTGRQHRRYKTLQAWFSAEWLPRLRDDVAKIVPIDDAKNPRRFGGGNKQIPNHLGLTIDFDFADRLMNDADKRHGSAIVYKCDFQEALNSLNDRARADEWLGDGPRSNLLVDEMLFRARLRNRGETYEEYMAAMAAKAKEENEMINMGPDE